MGKVDPYKELGVSRDATDAEIRSAFKQRAKETHPDKGGSPADFSKANSAKLILLNPKKRAKFDATGDLDDEPDNELSKILNFATGAIDAVLSECASKRIRPKDVDIISAGVKCLENALGKVRDEIRTAKANADECRKIAKRFKSKAGKMNRLMAVFESRAADFSRRAVACADDEDKYTKAIELLRDHEFEFDKPEPQSRFVMTLNIDRFTSQGV